MFDGNERVLWRLENYKSHNSEVTTSIQRFFQAKRVKWETDVQINFWECCTLSEELYCRHAGQGWFTSESSICFAILPLLFYFMVNVMATVCSQSCLGDGELCVWWVLMYRYSNILKISFCFILKRHRKLHLPFWAEIVQMLHCVSWQLAKLTASHICAADALHLCRCDDSL